ncbi:unnamed protein product [Sympodiomycopsis kandeliae]
MSLFRVARQTNRQLALSRSLALGSRGFQTSSQTFLRPSGILLAANPQSGKPASDSWKHTAQNIKEEAAQVRDSLESAVAGQSGATTKPKGEDLSGASEIMGQAKTITGEMAQQVPRPALLWGAAGVLPYVGTSGASLYLARQASLVANGLDSRMDIETASALLLHAQNVQIAYGAIILSFLGAIHWGFEWAKLGGRVGNLRYAMGVIPLAMAWPTILLGPQMALISQWSAYVLIWFIDLKSTTNGWAPAWYSTYRFWLTAAVGTSIIATLAGTQYYDIEPSRSSARGTAYKLSQDIAQDAKTKAKEIKASAHGDKGTVPVVGKTSGDTFTEKNDESFVQLRNPKKEQEKREQEEKERKEQEEKERKEKEEKEKKEKEEKGNKGKEGDKKEGDKKEGEEKEEKKEEESGDKDKDE